MYVSQPLKKNQILKKNKAQMLGNVHNKDKTLRLLRWKTVLQKCQDTLLMSSNMYYMYNYYYM